jgi:putative transcriptional regulator
MKSLQGHLLVASPYLTDPNFARAVVLLIQHNDEGAFGVVLNRPGDKTVKELWEAVEEPSCDCRKQIHVGGPVSGPLMAIHTDSSLSEVEVVPGVFFSAQKEHLERLVETDPQKLKVFVGHSGWGSGQLESELKQGAWLTTPATAEYIFFDDEEVWKRVTRCIGNTMVVSALRLKHVPEDPSLN